MTTRFSPAVEELIRVRMASGNYASEDSLLVEALTALAAEGDDVEAIQESIDAFNAGDTGLPVEQVFAELRARHGLKP
jgi:Arc/MetJ-type ribon-helix-helix transcriptional regulator